MTKDNLMKLKDVVQEVLEENVEARKSDIVLINLVLHRYGIDTSKPLRELLEQGVGKIMESITRTRRKVTQEHPDLKDKTTVKNREMEEQEYRAYARA